MSQTFAIVYIVPLPRLAPIIYSRSWRLQHHKVRLYHQEAWNFGELTPYNVNIPEQPYLHAVWLASASLAGGCENSDSYFVILGDEGDNSFF